MQTKRHTAPLNYYSFGMVMNERSFSSPAYRFGFNGKEKDNEINADAGDYDYGARIYDSRLGRFLSVDPLTKKFPYNSCFVFCQNKPIDGVDLDGLEWSSATTVYPGNGWTEVKYTVKIKVPNNDATFNEAYTKQYLSSIENATEAVFLKQDNTNKIQYSMDIQFEYVPKESIKPSDFSLTLQSVTSSNGLAEGGHTQTIGNANSNAIALTAKINGHDVNPGARNFAHELGHSAGLYHPYDLLVDADTKQKYLAGQIPGNLLIQNAVCDQTNTCNDDLTKAQLGIINRNVVNTGVSVAPPLITLDKSAHEEGGSSQALQRDNTSKPVIGQKKLIPASLQPTGEQVTQ